MMQTKPTILELDMNPLEDTLRRVDAKELHAKDYETIRTLFESPIQAKIYELQKLRCNLCGIVFTGQSPDGVGSEKYDATAGSMIALLKYGTGMPFNRAENLQGNMGIPLIALFLSGRQHAGENLTDVLVRRAAMCWNLWR